MRFLERLHPASVIGTNAFEPRSQKTWNYLESQYVSDPIYVLCVNGELWVVDGNHRRDYALQHSQSIDVLVIETDSDWQFVKKHFESVYAKVTTIERLKTLLEGRLTNSAR